MVLGNIPTFKNHQQEIGRIGGQKESNLLSKGLGGEGGGFKPNNPSWVGGYGYFYGATQNFNLYENSMQFDFHPKCQIHGHQFSKILHSQFEDLHNQI